MGQISEVSALVGKVFGKEVQMEEMQRRAKKAGFTRVRVMEANSCGDMQYDIERLSVYLNNLGAIDRVMCG